MSLLQALNLPPRPAVKAAAAPARNDKLASAAEAWRLIHAQSSGRIAALKAAVTAHCADARPQLVKEIEKGLARLDGVMTTIDHRLADSMERAGKATDESARQAELKNAKKIFAGYIEYVKSEPLVAHMDRNPFGVKTDLRALLSAGLGTAAKAIG